MKGRRILAMLCAIMMLMMNFSSCATAFASEVEVEEEHQQVSAPAEPAPAPKPAEPEPKSAKEDTPTEKAPETQQEEHSATPADSDAPEKPVDNPQEPAEGQQGEKPDDTGDSEDQEGGENAEPTEVENPDNKEEETEVENPTNPEDVLNNEEQTGVEGEDGEEKPTDGEDELEGDAEGEGEEEVAPLAAPVIRADHEKVAAGETVHFTVEAPEAEKVEWSVSNEDGLIVGGLVEDGAFQWSHDVPGTYEVTVTAIRGEEAQSASIAIEVTEPDYSDVQVSYTAVDLFGNYVGGFESKPLAKGEYTFTGENAPLSLNVEYYTYQKTVLNGKKLASLAYSEDEAAWVYTDADGATGVLTEDALLQVVFREIFKETEYTYTDAYIDAVVTVQYPVYAADDAQLFVTPVTASTKAYNYDAYMEALNQSDEEKTYDEDNTLLYDFSFRRPKKDDLGNVIPNEWYEVQPKGTVTVNVTFRRGQLSKGLGAESQDDVEVIHLPLDKSALKDVDTTAEATEITADDVNVQPIQTLDNPVVDEVDFKTAGFSLFAFAVPEGQSTQYTVNAKLVNMEGTVLGWNEINGNGVSQATYWWYASYTADDTIYYNSTFTDVCNSPASFTLSFGDKTPTRIDVGIANVFNYNPTVDIIRNAPTLNVGDPLGENYIIDHIEGPTESNDLLVYLSERPLEHHTATVVIPNGVVTDNLYVLFIQPGEVDYSFNAKPVTSDTNPTNNDDTTTYTVVSDGKFYKNSSQVRYVKENETLVVLVKQPNFNANNLTKSQYESLDNKFGNGDKYPAADSPYMVLVDPVSSTNGATGVEIKVPTYTAELRLYEGWGERTGFAKLADSHTLTANDATGNIYTATIQDDGEISFTKNDESVSALPELSGWKIDDADVGGKIDGYTMSVERDGTTYVIKGTKPDTYGIRIDYYNGWDNTLINPVTLPADNNGTVIATVNGQTYTGTVGKDGSVTLNEGIPANAEGITWRWENLNHDKIGTFKFESHNKMENPTKNDETHEYVFEVKKKNTEIVIAFYEPWALSRSADGPEEPIDGGRLTLKRGNEVANIITVDDHGNITAIQKQAPNGDLNNEELGPDVFEHPDEFRLVDNNHVLGGYVLSTEAPQTNVGQHQLIFEARKPGPYDAKLALYDVNGDEVTDVALPKAYTLKATDADDGVHTATVRVDGTIEWNDRKPTTHIKSFQFLDGETPTTWLGDYQVDESTLSVESITDEQLMLTAGAYVLRADQRAFYPAKFKYTDNTDSATGTENYYIVAKHDDVLMAYAPVPAASEELNFVGPDGNTAVSSLPKEYDYSLVKVAAGKTPADSDANAVEEFGFGSYDLSLPPSLRQDDDGAKYLEFKASKVVEGSKIWINTYGYNGEELAPNPAFGNGYYLRVRVHSKQNHAVVGWNLLPITWSGQSTEITIVDFVDLNDKPLQASPRIPFNIDSHYIEVDTEGNDAYPARIVKNGGGDLGTANWGNAIDPTKVDDNPPDGYAFIKGEASEDGQGYIIKLKKDTKKNYNVRLKFETEKAADVRLSDNLWVKVTLTNQSTGETYGFAQVPADAVKQTGDGYIYVDVPVDTWTRVYNGQPYNDGKYTGNESSVRVELISVTGGTPSLNDGNSYSVLKAGSYVNNARITKYPTFTTGVDHFEQAGTPINENGVDVPTTDIYDVVTLDINDDKFDGYSLEYILNGYNIVTLCPNTTASPSKSGEGAFGPGDFLMKNHCMGGVLIRGDIIHETGTGVADSEFITKPSVIGGYVPANGQPFINNRENNNYTWNGYIGEMNTVVGDVVNGTKASGSKQRPDGSLRGYTGSAGYTIANANSYMDWDRLQSMVTSTSNALAEAGRTDVVTKKANNVYQVSAGANAIIDYPQNTIVTINVVAKDEQGHDITDPNVLPATVVTNTGSGTYIPPKVLLNGKPLTTVEDGSGMSLLWNFPNASNINLTTDVTPEFGHVVAPQALIDVQGGNYSGCMVGNNVKSAGEGHLYPYNGGTLIGFYGEFDFAKTVNGGTPNHKQKYSFVMEQLLESVKTIDYVDVNSFWQELQTIENVNGNVVFKDVSFTREGTFYFKAYEMDAASHPEYDQSKYLIEVVTEAVTNDQETDIRMKSVKYYKITAEEGLVTDTDNGDSKYSEIHLDGHVSGPFDILSWDSENNKADMGVTFENTYEANGAATIEVTKHLEGGDLDAGQFTFKLSALNGAPLKKANGTAYTPNEMTIRNAGEGVAKKFPVLNYVLDDHGQEYKYKIEEVIPDDAENSAGKKYSEKTDGDIGPWKLGNITYADPNVIYVKVTVGEDENNDHKLSPAKVEYFKDEACSQDKKLNSAEFTNIETQTGELEISKQVVSPIAAEESQEFTFTIELSDKTISGTFSRRRRSKDCRRASGTQ